jgi:hypothetical protein
MWEDLLGKRVNEIIEASCCRREAHPMLRSEMSENPPKLIPWLCTHGDCDKCGISKILKIKECPALLQCDILVKTQKWKLNLRQGTDKKGDQNTQIELDETILPMSELIDRLIEQLEKNHKHQNQATWLNLMRKIDTKTLPSNEILVFTDFSASPDLRAKMTDNCSADAHAVLDVFVVLHSRRKVTVEKEDMLVSTMVYDCEVW